MKKFLIVLFVLIGIISCDLPCEVYQEPVRIEIGKPYPDWNVIYHPRPMPRPVYYPRHIYHPSHNIGRSHFRK